MPRDTACACDEGQAAPGPLTRPRPSPSPSPAVTLAECYCVTCQAQSRALPTDWLSQTPRRQPPLPPPCRRELRALCPDGPVGERQVGSGWRRGQLFRRSPARLRPPVSLVPSASHPRTHRCTQGREDSSSRVLPRTSRSRLRRLGLVRRGLTLWAGGVQPVPSRADVRVSQGRLLKRSSFVVE